MSTIIKNITPPTYDQDSTTETPAPASSNTGKRNSQRYNCRQDNLIGENRDFVDEKPELEAVLGLML